MATPEAATRPQTPGSRRSWATRSLTPLDVAFERSKNTSAHNRLRVPQPGGVSGSTSYGELPSATLLAGYATIQSHLSAARSLANF